MRDKAGPGEARALVSIFFYDLVRRNNRNNLRSGVHGVGIPDPIPCPRNQRRPQTKTQIRGMGESRSQAFQGNVRATRNPLPRLRQLTT
jgi:hypothetical protein